MLRAMCLAVQSECCEQGVARDEDQEAIMHIRQGASSDIWVFISGKPIAHAAAVCLCSLRDLLSPSMVQSPLILGVRLRFSTFCLIICIFARDLYKAQPRRFWNGTWPGCFGNVICTFFFFFFFRFAHLFRPNCPRPPDAEMTSNPLLR